jgi:methionine-rich copper-binding protein CopC
MRQVALAAMMMLATGPAFAHAQLRGAVPAAGSTVTTPPTEVALSFSEAVEPRFSRIEVLDAAGQPMQKPDARTVPGDPTRLVVSLMPLKPGTYRVIWHATSTDTHKTEGSHSFTVSR